MASSPETSSHDWATLSLEIADPRLFEDEVEVATAFSIYIRSAKENCYRSRRMVGQITHYITRRSLIVGGTTMAFNADAMGRSIKIGFDDRITQAPTDECRRFDSG